jgi:Tfp pilus assembly protein PilO
MDLAALKEMDIKDLFRKINIDPSIFKDKKTVTKIAIGAGSVIIFLIFYYFFLNPIVKEQEGRILVMEENIQKINEYQNNITQLKASIKKLEPDYEKNSKLFHSQKEVEGLYQNISNYALTNGLSIVNLNKKDAIAVGPNNQAVDQNNNNSGETNPEGQILYYKIPVDYKIQGNYLGYLKFRRALAQSNKVINFDKEQINVDTNLKGVVVSEGTISIVGLPNEF